MGIHQHNQLRFRLRPSSRSLLGSHIFSHHPNPHTNPHRSTLPVFKSISILNLINRILPTPKQPDKASHRPKWLVEFQSTPFRSITSPARSSSSLYALSSLYSFSGGSAMAYWTY